MEEFGLSLPVGAPLSITELLINLAIGVGLAMLLRWHFERFGSTLSNRGEFASVFPFILLTTILIITVVKSSLALSLGLVGALSIVRFRTPIKEPEELAYLFMAIAMGLGLGANQTRATMAASVSILAVVALLRIARLRRDDKNLFLSVQLSEEQTAAAAGSDGNEPHLERLNEIIGRHSSVTDLRRIDARQGTIEATYFVDLDRSGRVSELIEELNSAYPGIDISFIDQSQMPSV